MPNGNVSRDQVEAHRLEIERIRVNLEETRTFLENWRVNVQPLHEDRLMSREQGYGLAKMALQSIFVLNGGALIAFPTFAQIVGTNFREQAFWALSSITSFIVGLVLITLATLIAYRSTEADAEAISEEEERVKLGMKLSRVLDTEKSELDKRREQAARVGEERNTRAAQLRLRALRFGVAAIIAFIFGAAFAILVLSAIVVEA